MGRHTQRCTKEQVLDARQADAEVPRLGQMWWYAPTIPELTRLRHLEFKASLELSYVVKTGLEKKKQYKTTAREFWKSQVIRREGGSLSAEPLRVACFNLGLLGNLKSPPTTTGSHSASLTASSSASFVLETLVQGHLGDSISGSTSGAPGAK